MGAIWRRWFRSYICRSRYMLCWDIGWTCKKKINSNRRHILAYIYNANCYLIQNSTHHCPSSLLLVLFVVYVPRPTRPGKRHGIVGNRHQLIRVCFAVKSIGLALYCIRIACANVNVSEADEKLYERWRAKLESDLAMLRWPKTISAIVVRFFVFVFALVFNSSNTLCVYVFNEIQKIHSSVKTINNWIRNTKLIAENRINWMDSYEKEWKQCVTLV